MRRDIMKTAKELYNKSKELYNNIRKQGKNGQSSKWAYYYCKCIINGKKDVKGIKQADAPAKKGNPINLKLNKNDYLEIMKKYTSWVEKNKRLPSYVLIKGNKVKATVFTAYVGYIFKTYCETKKLPATATIKSDIYKSPYKKYGHSTISGCDNRGQNTGYYCACHSMQEVIRNLTGKVIKQSTLAGWAGTTTSGTGHAGIETAIAKAAKELNVNFKLKWYDFSELGWNGINNILKSNDKDCIIHNLYLNQYGHYEVINSISGNNIKVQNSLGSYCSNGCYCGYVEDRTTTEFRSYINGISQKSILVIKRE